MALPFTSDAMEIAFRNQSAKILNIYHLGNGWEGWAQVEIALGLKQRLEGLAQKIAAVNVNVQFNSTRESGSYEGTKKRCDFLITSSYPALNQSTVQFYELKCMRANLTLEQFATEVGKDIDKVKNGEPLEEWMDQADNVNGWVTAITVSTGNSTEQSIAAAMNGIALQKGIQWLPLESRKVTDVVRVWVWCKNFKP